MTRLRIIRPPHECAPGPDGQGYQFTHETGFKSYGLDPDTWWRHILKHRRDNGLTIPDDMRAIAEDQLCQLLPPGWCQYSDGAPQTKFTDARLGLNDIWHGTLVLAKFVEDGCPIVEPEIAEARAKTCASCQFNVGITGCAPCVGLAALVGRAAKGKTRSDELLTNKACAICKCSSRAQVWLPVEILEAGTTDEMMAKWPDFCWKGNGLKELKLTRMQKPPTHEHAG